MTTVARGSRAETSAFTASGSRSRAPLSATMTGSSTTGASPTSASASPTASIVSTVPSMPILTASTPMSSATAFTWPMIASRGIGVTPSTARVFCQVTAVIAVMPWTPHRANAFKSAWMPAPPPESEPAIDSTLGTRRELVETLIPTTRIDPGCGSTHRVPATALSIRATNLPTRA